MATLALLRRVQPPATVVLLVGALLLSLFVLVVAGQTTGALFEEPYIWLVLGLSIALRRAAVAERAIRRAAALVPAGVDAER